MDNPPLTAIDIYGRPIIGSFILSTFSFVLILMEFNKIDVTIPLMEFNKIDVTINIISI